MIEIHGLSVAYGPLAVLRNLSLTVNAGERVALIGANGVGKTTLLRCILGQIRSTGTIRVGGIEVATGGAAARRLIGYVPQVPAFPRGMTVGEVMAFFQRLRGEPARPGPLLQRVGLSDAARRPVASLSGGMARRLTLAVAMIGDPSLLLLDEPAVGLDAEGEADLYRWLDGFHGAGVTVLLTAHQFRTLQYAADRVILLRAGGVALDQPIARVREARRFMLLVEGPEDRVRALSERLAGDIAVKSHVNGALCLSVTQRDLPRLLSRLDGAAFEAFHIELREAGLDEAIEDLLVRDAATQGSGAGGGSR